LRNSSPDCRVEGLRSNTGERGRVRAVCRETATATEFFPDWRPANSNCRGLAEHITCRCLGSGGEPGRVIKLVGSACNAAKASVACDC
jgi:hypothetical protein